MCAFDAHHFKEISRGQLASAARFFLKGEERKSVPKADKYQLVSLLAPVFLRKGIVALQEGADVDNLCRNDVVKERTFV